MLTVIISSASANIFNKKFLTGTKVSIIQFALFAYIFALLGSLTLFITESLIRYQTLPYSPLPIANLLKAEEVLSVIVLN